MAHYIRDPKICCTQRTPFSSKAVDESSSGAFCTLLPYVISLQRCGESCFLTGGLCPTLNKSFFNIFLSAFCKFFHYASVYSPRLGWCLKMFWHSQSSDISWYFLSTESRCSACFLPTYSTPKSSTISINCMGRHFWRHSPGVVDN